MAEPFLKEMAWAHRRKPTPAMFTGCRCLTDWEVRMRNVGRMGRHEDQFKWIQLYYCILYISNALKDVNENHYNYYCIIRRENKATTTTATVFYSTLCIFIYIQVAATIKVKKRLTVTWIFLQWLKGTPSQSECTEALRVVPLLIRSSSGAQVHLLGDHHSATADTLKETNQRSPAMSFSTFSIGQWSSYL